MGNMSDVQKPVEDSYDAKVNLLQISGLAMVVRSNYDELTDCLMRLNDEYGVVFSQNGYEMKYQQYLSVQEKKDLVYCMTFCSHLEKPRTREELEDCIEKIRRLNTSLNQLPFNEM